MLVCVGMYTYVHSNTMSNHTGEMIGFTNLGDVSNEIASLVSPNTTTSSVATHVLTFMMRGVFNNKEHTVAHYPTTEVAGEQLYSFVWTVIKALEIAGFKVNSYHNL